MLLVTRGSTILLIIILMPVNSPLSSLIWALERLKLEDNS
jgi:hypothetical protein